MAESQPSRSELATAALGTRALLPLAQFEQLALLDDHWTAQLETAHATAEEPDIEGLLVLADQMDLALGRAAEAAYQLRVLLEEGRDRDDQSAMLLLAESSPETAATLTQILNDVEESSPTEAVIVACRFLEQNTGAERELLSRKRETLSEGRLPDPELSPPIRCMVTVATIGCVFALAAAGAVSVIGAPAAISLGVVGGGGSLATTWKKSGCKKAWKRLKAAVAI